MTYPWHIEGNKIYKGLLAFQFLMTLIIAYLTETLLIGFLIGGIIIALPYALFFLAQKSTYTRHAAAIATQLFTALHIQQSGGEAFMHFEIFSVLAVTIVYRDWKVVLSSVAVIAVHHVGFFLMQSSGLPVYIFEAHNLAFYVLFIHAFFAVAEGIIIAYIAINSKQEALTGLELTQTIDKIMHKQDHFDLNVSTSGASPTLKQFNSLIGAFSHFVAQSKSVSSAIVDVAEEVGVLSGSVKTASLNTSDQVNTIAAATEEMAVNNESVSARAANVNNLSNEAKESSIDAKNVVIKSNSDILDLKHDLSNTSEAILQLSEKCKQIEDFMASIKAISEQTNLLALNAAIESARAGEHGRGFAVVADEVRQLAMRTKDNTEQISEITTALIQESDTSVKQVKDCVDKSGQVSESSDSAKEIIDTVVSKISSVSEDMMSVSTAISEQTQASAEISRSTSLLSSTSESLTSSADRTEQNFNALQNQIKLLNAELNRFS